MEQTDLEPRKLFVGGLPRWGVTPERMRSHFARYGHVVDALVMLCPDGMGRGFGFVEFQDEVAALRALDVRERDKHDAFFGRRVDVKKAEKKQGIRYVPTQSTTYNHQNADSKKIFVGGLGDKITKDDLSSYFEKFGTITDAVVFYDKLTRKARGFGFVTFDSQEAADKVLEKSFHELKGIKVETKNAEPRGSMVRGAWSHRSPANSYDGMYSPYNIPFVTGPYFVPYPYYSPSGIINYGYMMNQIGTSNDTGMMAMLPFPARSAHHGRSYGSEVATLKLETGQQRIDISTSTSMKSDPLKPDSNLL
ncbi:hypothetical protein SEVIR_9G073800v4 [Setaria viridis]|nr:heterogeneous nuclear ribonucleoprotein D-like [Setaria italica]XP_034571064.1 heterogeneous nuclear ribonucleoprotein D-like [Setaria viridis]RCV40687.1 hypothetical protein SETIT_9G075200v2 [Setaria italica]TKV91111.1 hypothetical protein SEVIR_9G073800v2 [Setaria viridis]